MKITKFMKAKVLVLSMIMASVSLLQSCGGDDDEDSPVQVDTTELIAVISTANTTIGAAVEGLDEGQYMNGSKAILQKKIDLAQTVLDDDTFSQGAVDNTVIAINNALIVFEKSKNIPIDPNDLVGYWKFSASTGTSVQDFSGNEFTGTFGNEAGFGEGTPQWSEDRHGDANNAISFDNGAKITVPYNTVLNPGVMSISVWVKADVIKGNNRFIGLHSWNGYKFQLQDANKAFFTSATTEGVFDKDTNPELDLNTWYHLTVTVGDGKTTFFINGVQSQVWEDTPGTFVKVEGHDLVFGVGSSKYAATDANYDDDKIIPLAWGGYFQGALDDIRIYKTVLTASQVKGLYYAEKVQD
ncbi:MAG: LamG domain-containing protein [Flavobacteriaceae bacterium]|nr:LamG domain-containing protein [Flavobacteriaceae bacterium]